MNPTVTAIIFLAAVIFVSGFVLLMFFAISAVRRLKALLIDLEKTSVEARGLIVKLQDIGTKVEEDVAKFDSILDASKETVESVSNSLKFVNKKILKQSAGLVAIIPAIKMGWDLIKKLKAGGKQNV
ncbi:MAG: hypothetical protein KAW12_29930 [Candidatus Aminicenantes bacterium]|nr:hypothetical protein [Candidatus Aminicenantes bacterium]